MLSTVEAVMVDGTHTRIHETSKNKVLPLRLCSSHLCCRLSYMWRLYILSKSDSVHIFFVLKKIIPCTVHIL